MHELAELCGDDRLHYELTRELLSITQQQRAKGRRAGLYEPLGKSFSRHFYDDREDALNRARNIAEERKQLERNRLKVITHIVMESKPDYLEGDA